MLETTCILIHITALAVVLHIWRWRALVYPGTYFIVIWLVSVISEWYLIDIGNAFVVDESKIDELNIYAAFTSFCFTIVSIIFRNDAKKLIKVNIVRNKNMFIIYGYICLILVFINFIYRGASLSFASNRLATVGDLAHLSRQASFLDSIIAILSSSLPFMSIAMGSALASYLIDKKKSVYNMREIALPFLIVFINALIIGGRNPIAIGIKQYLLGLGMSLPYIVNRTTKIRLVKFLAIVIVCFSLFTTVVAANRAIAFGTTGNMRVYDNKIAESFSGVMEYMSSHYWGYQLRRNDFSSGEKLEYGVCTFYGLGDIKIPFSSQLGVNDNLWSLLGVDYEPLDVYKSGVEGFYTTSSIYSLMVRDFGVKGTYIAIIFLVVITQLIFSGLFH